MTAKSNTGKLVLFGCLGAVLLLAGVCVVGIVVWRLMPGEFVANMSSSEPRTVTLEGFEESRIASYSSDRPLVDLSSDEFDILNARFVQEFSGQGTMVTPTFRVTTKDWAVVSVTQAGPLGMGGAFVLSAYRHGEQGHPDASADILLVQGSNTSESRMRNGPGDFYFSVSSSQPWCLAVFDMGDGELGERGKYFAELVGRSKESQEVQRGILEQLAEGQTYDEVVEIMGVKGKRIRAMEANGKTVETYGWRLPYNNIEITFEDEIVTGWTL